MSMSAREIYNLARRLAQETDEKTLLNERLEEHADHILEAKMTPVEAFKMLNDALDPDDMMALPEPDSEAKNVGDNQPYDKYKKTAVADGTGSLYGDWAANTTWG